MGIKIGIFTDEECSNYESSLEVENYLQNDDGYNIKLSYHLLKQTYPANECVASCLEEDEDQNNNNGDDDEEPETAEICQELYEAAGKCEKDHYWGTEVHPYVFHPGLRRTCRVRRHVALPAYQRFQGRPCPTGWCHGLEVPEGISVIVVGQSGCEQWM